MTGIRWGYALNQWDTNIDAFVRRRDHERAFKTISISGFSGVELTAVSFGPWEPFGSPDESPTLRFARRSARVPRRLRARRRAAMSTTRSSGSTWRWGAAPDPLDPDALEQIPAPRVWFADAVHRLGGDTLVVRPVGSAWQTGALNDDQIGTLARLWNEVGRSHRRA